MIDYRKLLKDTIRGMIWEYDVPAVPGSTDGDGEGDCSPEEYEAFFDLVAEVVGEEGESRQIVLREIARLEQEYLGS